MVHSWQKVGCGVLRVLAESGCICGQCASGREAGRAGPNFSRFEFAHHWAELFSLTALRSV